MEAPPGRFTYVVDENGEEREVRVVDGHVFVCVGCCCGNGAKNIPEVPVEAFKRQWKERGIRYRVHLTISGCLGPCAAANVVLVMIYGRSLWLHSIDTEAQVSAIYDYVERVLGVRRFLAAEMRICQRTRSSATRAIRVPVERAAPAQA